MGKTLRKLGFQLSAGANIATVMAMLATGYADRLNPVHFPSMANLGLVFPVILAANLAFLLFWIVFHTKSAWIPVLGFLLCYQPVRTYMPINFPKETPEDAIKVLSYNVWNYVGWKDKGRPNPILEYIRRQNADILCLQEAETNEVGSRRVDSALNSVYPYHATTVARNGADRTIIYSKFRILRKEPIDYPSEGNHSTAFFLDIKGDTVIVVNNHFESIGLSERDKENFKGMVKGNIKGDSARQSSKTLFRKLNEASRLRAPQADAVAAYIARHRDKSMIVCGDFNDSPNSYARRTVARQLRDCYIQTGNGPGISYHLGGFYVRIDHLMCSKDLTPYNCKVDNQIKTSDHYPIYCWLKKARKP